MSKVLVVDDDEAFRILYRNWLDQEYKITLVSSGCEAIECFRRVRPDLVVLDTHTPETHGLGTIQQILSIDSQVPIILHSSYSSHKDNFQSWSADAYVEKSTDLSELKQNIKTLLAGSRRPIQKV